MLLSILPEPILPLDPITKFSIVLLIILVLPRLLERIKMPGLIGLLIGGLLIGPKGLDIIDAEGSIIHFLADVGKLMVMFYAGLEIDLEKFIKNGHKSFIYGLSTFLLPLLTGLFLGRIFGLSWNSATLLGSLLASHTLLALPILMKYGIIQREPITITIGATMFTDIAALVILAICVAIHTVGFSPSILAFRLTGMIIFIPLILLGTRWLAPRLLKTMHDSKNGQALYILLLIAIADIGAEAIHLEGIVGAFIVGLAVGDIIRKGPIREKIDTLGETLFIPMFFLIVGTLIDPLSFLKLSPMSLGLMITIIVGLIISKFIAAFLAGRTLKYARNEILCMWSLSIPQVAATLAAALVAHESINSFGERLISESTLDAILILVMVTSILGPILTQRYAKRLSGE